MKKIKEEDIATLIVVIVLSSPIWGVAIAVAIATW